MRPNPFHRRGPSPGAHPTWDHDAFAPRRVPYQLATGEVGHVEPHGLFQGPMGLTRNPYVAAGTARTMRRWLPASYGRSAPSGAMAWVQLSRRYPAVGIVHAPGVVSRPVRVLERGVDSRGGVRAHVVHRLPSAAEAARNPARIVVSTRVPTRATAQPLSPVKRLICRAFPGARGCGVAHRRSNPATVPRTRASFGTIMRQLLMGEEVVHVTRTGLEVARVQ